MRLILANGCFDPLHAGHVMHLATAKAMGGHLLVALTCDESVRREKGEGRPAMDEDTRAAVLNALRCVDGVAITPDVITALDRFRPQVFVKGPDYIGKIDEEVEMFCAKNGIEIVFTDTPKLSSTALLNELRGG